MIDAIAKQISNNQNENHVYAKAEAYLEKLCGHIWRLMLLNPMDAFCCWIEDSGFKNLIENACKDNNNKPLDCLPPNPRRLKLLANLVLRLRSGGAPCDNVEEVRRLLIFAYVYQFHNQLFMRWHYKREFWEELARWSLGEYSSIDNNSMIPDYFLSYKIITNIEGIVPPSYMTSFPDPCSINVFWMGPLIKEMSSKKRVMWEDFDVLFKTDGKLIS